mgnify:CR=1 FL=1
MSKFTMQGFYDFCKSKDEREKIDNKFWSTCALGLYMESIGEPFPKKRLDTLLVNWICHQRLRNT